MLARKKIKKALSAYKKQRDSILNKASIDEQILEKSRKASTKIKTGRY
tara:strand:- start:348 stop:491 length:144 start_codon:yes stop_codon:yes gene_type:complete